MPGPAARSRRLKAGEQYVPFLHALGVVVVVHEDDTSEAVIQGPVVRP